MTESKVCRIEKVVIDEKGSNYSFIISGDCSDIQDAIKESNLIRRKKGYIKRRFKFKN